MRRHQYVARGALYRYSNTSPRGLPSTDFFGIVQSEIYDPTLHPDAIEPPKGTSRSCKKPVPNMQIVDKDEFTHKFIVRSRWLPILEKVRRGSRPRASSDADLSLSQGEYKTPGRLMECKRWQRYCVLPDDEYILEQVFWTELDLQLSDPILARGRGNLEEGAQLRDGIEAFGEPIVFKLPNLGEAGFKLQSSKKGPV